LQGLGDVTARWMAVDDREWICFPPRYLGPWRGFVRDIGVHGLVALALGLGLGWSWALVGASWMRAEDRHSSPSRFGFMC
jgi:hypothetical protein